MKVLVEINLDPTWDDYLDCDVQLLEEDLLGELDKEGIVSARIVGVGADDSRN